MKHNFTTYSLSFHILCSYFSHTIIFPFLSQFCHTFIFPFSILLFTMFCNYLFPSSFHSNFFLFYMQLFSPTSVKFLLSYIIIFHFLTLLYSFTYNCLLLYRSFPCSFYYNFFFFPDNYSLYQISFLSHLLSHTIVLRFLSYISRYLISYLFSFCFLTLSSFLLFSFSL